MLVHHDLCFGCGRSNLFGLLLEAQSTGAGTVSGRCFIKQDHQGAVRGRAHEGIIAAALSEAMALAAGPEARVRRLEVEFLAPAPVGAFVEVQADTAQATARCEGAVIARAVGTFAG